MKSCTYVGLYGSGLLKFGPHLTLFASLLGFDIPTSSFLFIGNVFYYSCFHCFFFLNDVNIFVHCRSTGVSYISYHSIIKFVHQ